MSRRVKSWDDIIGHKNLVNYLQKSLEDNTVQDVILFEGDSGIGKSSIAKLLAIDLVCKYNPELRETLVKEVIDENKSTTSIKLFNMSEIQEKEEEIQKVRAELSLTFCNTKRKVLILDECHRMSMQAQDDILIDLEYLPEGLYVIFCTTEAVRMKKTLRGRCRSPFKLNNLTEVEAKTLCKKVIQENMLSFDMNEGTVISVICGWANNQPREIVNLLGNFAKGSAVYRKDLEVFLNITTSSSVIELLKYLYGSMVLGIDYINQLKIDDSFVSMLIEVTKVALGHNSQNVSVSDMNYIRSFMTNKDVNNLLNFTANVAGMDYLKRRRVISAFMRAHVDFCKASPGDINTSRLEEIGVVKDNVKVTEINAYKVGNVEPVISIDEMFSQGDIIK